MGIDWNRTIGHYARELGVSFQDAVGWLHKRNSSALALELLGLTPTTKLRDELSAFLISHLPVPETSSHRKLHSMVTEPSNKKPSHHAPLITRQATAEELARYFDQGEDFMSKVTMTKEEYLLKRQTMNRSQVASELGISVSTLYYWLEKWGIKEMEKEETALLAMKASDVQGITNTISAGDSDGTDALESNANQDASDQEKQTDNNDSGASDSRSLSSDLEDANVSDNDQKDAKGNVETGMENQTATAPSAENPEEKLVLSATPSVVLSIAVGHPTLPETLHLAKLDRIGLLDAAIQLAQEAITQTYEELVELIGEEEATTYLRKYVERRLQSA